MQLDSLPEQSFATSPSGTFYATQQITLLLAQLPTDRNCFYVFVTITARGTVIGHTLAPVSAAHVYALGLVFTGVSIFDVFTV